MTPSSPPGGGRTPRFSTLLAAQLGNDMRVVLAAMVGAVDAIRTRLPIDAGVDQDFAAIDGAIDTAFHLCDELTMLGAPTRPEPVVVDVNELILRTQALLERILGGDIRLLLALDATMPVIRGDEAQLEWMLLNLAVNAREAMPRGGVATINTALVHPYEAGADKPPQRGFVRLTFSDTGSGMSPEVSERAFEPFFTTKRDGSGLGLTSVALTVYALQGRLRLEGHKPAGTEVRIYLPLLETTTAPR